MIIILKSGSTQTEAQDILDHIEGLGLRPLYMPGTERIVIGAIGDERVLESLHLENYPQVERVTPILAPYKLVSREIHPHDTIVRLGKGSVGGDQFAVIAGPCAVESYEQMRETAEAVKSAGATALRGGAFKPRTSPYSFQGLGAEGLKILETIGRELQIEVVTEVVDIADVEAVAQHADALQVGARNMQNFRLLQAVAKCGKPVVLKRGIAATIQDLLLAAEYILDGGNADVILCERGIKTFETATRNTLDLNAVPYIKQRSHLPVIVDPSHGSGLRDLVAPMSRAAVACGADGIMVEVHRDPAHALSDGQQSLYPAEFAKLMRELRPFVEASGKSL
ncbi:MAG: 3-deoxy-7-phosphoheptulonate synthase [Verrucomicrobiota bacterium]|jgi:3-deoxy-7-phosphoheptulonate synthase